MEPAGSNGSPGLAAPHGRRRRRRPGPPRAAPPKRPRSDPGPAHSDGDRLFAQKCRELQGFIRPLAELLDGLKTGRYDKGLSSFQQSVAMDRIQRIIGVLQKPEMGERYLGTLLQVEMMLKVWFPHVAPKTAASERRRRHGDTHRDSTSPAPALPVCALPRTAAAASPDPPVAVTAATGPPAPPRPRSLPGDPPDHGHAAPPRAHTAEPPNA